MTAFSAMLDALYTDPNTGVDVLWTPAGGSAQSLRGLVILGDAVVFVEGPGLSVQTPRTVKLRVAEVAAKGAGDPVDGDAIAVAGQSLVITGDPRNEDPFRLEWTCDLARA
jgi:hypothetical protein